MLTQTKGAAAAPSYRDIQIGTVIYRANLNNGKVNRVEMTGRGKQVRYMASPVARALTKAIRMGLAARKDLRGLVAGIEGIFGVAPAKGQVQ